MKDAMAVGGEFGILEGRTLALVHPLVMSGLFFYTLWAGYLGWQWRRVRTIQDEINQLKKQQVKSPAPAAAAVPAGAAASDASPPPPAEVSPVEAKIQKLTEERKELLKDRTGIGTIMQHYNCKLIFPNICVCSSVVVAITVLWAAAAALVPAMQKGNETARNLHIALNTLNVLLFIWQIPTGFDIVQKVFEFTNWP
ncbi:hypothetical protein ACMD2_18061 [Ananas comosus]|uniref:Uncharacterized protein n=1 Tax=Ananas comosus TaxID=4615 RepID=A0A199UJC2_ANACO|nr:hypothetical protein ACMD2_18061 [Ananas comosus]